MKNLILGLLTTVIIASNGHAQVRKLLSKTMLQAGVKAITEQQSTDKTIFSFETFKSCFVNFKKENFNHFIIEKSNKKYTLVDKDNPELRGRYTAVVDINTITLNTPTIKGNIKDIGEKPILDNNTIILLLAITEIEGAQPSTPISYDTFSNNSEGCSFWDTYYSIGWGLNSAASESHLTYVIQKAAIQGEFKNCKAISKKYETTCGDFGCYSTFAWCCTD